MSTPPSPPTISVATDPSMAGTPSQHAISNGVLLAAVIFLFMVVVFVFLLYLYAKRFLGTNPMLNGASTPSSRFIFVGDSPLPGRGLPASVLRSLPVAVYAASPRTPGGVTGKKADALECAVCLSEVADGEKVRTLPKCDHRFHVECIDMWFHSHDTCPLCRAPVGADAAAEEGGLPRVPREDPATVDFPMFPTNVLFWGTHDDAFTNTSLGMRPPAAAAPIAAASSTSSASAAGLRKESLVIDIPNRPMMVVGASSPLPASRMPGDDLRSPMSARLRSLRRLLSRGKQAVAGTSASSPRGGGDIEQGLAGRPPKTPKTPPSSN